MSTNLPTSDGAVKLRDMIVGSITTEVTKALGVLKIDLLKEIKQESASSTQELSIAIERLTAKLDLVIEASEGKKKSIKDKKTPAAAATGGDTTEKVDGILVSPPTKDTGVKAFAMNKLIYFREQFKTDPAYRSKYVTKELEDIMSKEQTITSKVKEEQKLIAQSTFCWNYFRSKNTDIIATIEAEYLAAKRNYEMSNNPTQQTAEPRTPDGN